MKYNDRAKLDSSQVSKGGNGGKIALGGGAGLVVLVIALLLGVDPGTLGLGDAGGQAEPSTAASPNVGCQSGGDIAKDRDCRFVAYTNSIQSYWDGAVTGYQQITVREFTGRVSTACGSATSAVGPFYCSADTTVYLDLGFFDQLTGELGAKGGDAAEAYVLAHEFGHHIQQLSGTMAKVQRQGQSTGATSAAVRLELQADCYAGVWFANATKDPDSPIADVTRADLADALDAAAAVGDDRIQSKMQGQVTPESWTHGSAAMRQRWLTTGFTSGNPRSCDTFAAKTLD
jgi:predicted metalloprotease